MVLVLVESLELGFWFGMALGLGLGLGIGEGGITDGIADEGARREDGGCGGCDAGVGVGCGCGGWVGGSTACEEVAMAVVAEAAPVVGGCSIESWDSERRKQGLVFSRCGSIYESGF